MKFKNGEKQYFSNNMFLALAVLVLTLLGTTVWFINQNIQLEDELKSEKSYIMMLEKYKEKPKNDSNDLDLDEDEGDVI